jgi:hypothetical protein
VIEEEKGIALRGVFLDDWMAARGKFQSALRVRDAVLRAGKVVVHAISVELRRGYCLLGASAPKSAILGR